MSTTGDPRERGCLVRTDRCGDSFPVLEDSGVELIDRADWPALISESQAELVSYVKNQGPTDMCASNATTSCIGHRIRHTCGISIDLSPASVYNHIANGPGGSTISDNLRQIRDVGCLPTDTTKNREILQRAGLDDSHVMLPSVYYARISDAAKETAKHFRGGEWYDVRTFKGLVSCLLLGFPVVYGRRSHAILGVGARFASGRIQVLYLNSWGRWGGPAGEWEYGFGTDSEQLLTSSIPSYGAFALRTWKISDVITNSLIGA